MIISKKVGLVFQLVSFGLGSWMLFVAGGWWLLGGVFFSLFSNNISLKSSWGQDIIKAIRGHYNE